MLKYLQLLLTPIGFIYNAITQLRLYLIKPYKAKVPVICIGNINVGGVGKTPFTQFLANYLKTKGFKPAILSRGYKGKLKYVKVDNKKHSASDIGDEPLMLSYTAPTYVGQDREKTAKMAIKNGANILLLDDGFQSPTILKDISFVVVDGKTGFGNYNVIPSGPLREYLYFGKKRASAFVIIGNDKTNVKKHLQNFPTIDIEVKTKFTALKNAKYFAFAGIGKPEKFFTTLKETGAIISKTKSFPDHYKYSKSDLKDIINLCERKKLIPITTLKDWVKFKDDYKQKIQHLDIFYKIKNAKVLDKILTKF